MKSAAVNFDFPQSFLLVPLVPLVGLVGWFWPRLGLFQPLRIIIVLLLVTLLAGPHVRKQQNALDLVVLLDRSESTENLIDKGLRGWADILEDAKPGQKDTLRFVNYAAEIADAGIDGSSFTGSRKLTRTGLVLSNLASQVDGKKPTRVLLFTDGYSTEPLIEAAAQLKERGVPLDFRVIFFVGEQGGGFLIAGGKRSFGSGGYFQSEIDDLLPVSMELKSEHRKLAVALAIVMDRSGSMGMGVAGGNKAGGEDKFR